MVVSIFLVMVYHNFLKTDKNIFSQVQVSLKQIY